MAVQEMTRACYTVCPFCGYEHELSSAVVKRRSESVVEPRMKPGDVTLCIKCGELSVLSFNEMLRKPSHDESSMLARDPAVRTLREAWRDTVGKRTEQ